MGRNGLKKSGKTVHIRHTHLPCGKQYSGNRKTVDKLIAIHTKICEICQLDHQISISNVNTNEALSNLSNIRKTMESMRNK